MKKLAKTFLSMMLFLGLMGYGTATASASGNAEESKLGRVDKQLSISDSSSITIDLTSTTVDVGVSPDNKVHITYYNKEYFKYEIEQNNDKLIFKQLRLDWSGIKLERPTDATVLIPKQFSGTLTVDTSSGDIRTDTVNASGIDLNSSSGRIDAE